MLGGKGCLRRPHGQSGLEFLCFSGDGIDSCPVHSGQWEKAQCPLLAEGPESGGGQDRASSCRQAVALGPVLKDPLEPTGKALGQCQ